MYDKIILEHPYDILVDDALYRLAKLYDDILLDLEKAMELYEKILIEQRSSIFTAESRKRFDSGMSAIEASKDIDLTLLSIALVFHDIPIIFLWYESFILLLINFWMLR